jgi:16S rRNA C967 or C1407 C5-methylase (RsmB/RsmF family)
MKDGNLAVLYTKETRKVYATCSVAAEQTEQQSSRAAEQQCCEMIKNTVNWSDTTCLISSV